MLTSNKKLAQPKLASQKASSQSLNPNSDFTPHPCTPLQGNSESAVGFINPRIILSTRGLCRFDLRLSYLIMNV